MDNPQRLIAEITSGDDRRAETALMGYTALGAQALPVLKDLLASPEPDVRWWATWGLAEIRDPQVPPLLIAALHDADLNVRQAATLALRQQPSPEAVPDLIGILHATSLEDADPILAHLAVAALIAIGAAAVPALIQILEGDPLPGRSLAARALAMIGDQRAVPALLVALDSGSAVLEHWAEEGLQRMGVGMTFVKPE